MFSSEGFMKIAVISILAILGIVVAFFAGQYIKPLFKPAVNSAAVVTQVQELSRLETSQYTIEKVISQDKKYVGVKTDTLILVAHGEVIAGVDLSHITEEKVQVTGQTVIIQLPPAQIFNIDNAVDEARTYVFERNGLPFLTDKDLETKARARASNEIIFAACESGILQSATDNAVKAVERLLTPLGSKVTVIPASIPACPVQSTSAPTP